MDKQLLELYYNIIDEGIYISDSDKKVLSKLDRKQIKDLLRLKGEKLEFALKMYYEKKFTEAYKPNIQMGFVRMICGSNTLTKNEIFEFICDDNIVKSDVFKVTARKKLVNLLTRCKDKNIVLTVIDITKFLVSKNISKIFELIKLVLHSSNNEKASLVYDLIQKLYEEGYEKNTFKLYKEESMKRYSEDVLMFVKTIVNSNLNENAKLCYEIALMSEFSVNARLTLMICASKISKNRVLTFKKIIYLFYNEIKDSMTLPYDLTKLDKVGKIALLKIEDLLLYNQLSLDTLLSLLIPKGKTNEVIFIDDCNDVKLNTSKTSKNLKKASDNPYL